MTDKEIRSLNFQDRMRIVMLIWIPFLCYAVVVSILVLWLGNKYCDYYWSKHAMTQTQFQEWCAYVSEVEK